MKTVTVTTSYKIPLCQGRGKYQFSRNFHRPDEADKFVADIHADYQGLHEDERIERVEVDEE